MGDIELSIYTKFMGLKSSVEVHYDFSFVHDQNFLFQRSVWHRRWVQKQFFNMVFMDFEERLR